MLPTPDPLGLTHDIYVDYGLLGLVIFLVIVFVLPPLIKKVMPFLVKGWQDERKRAEQREERQVKAMEELAHSSQGIQTILSAMNVRLDMLQRDVDCVKIQVVKKGRRGQQPCNDPG